MLCSAAKQWRQVDLEHHQGHGDFRSEYGIVTRKTDAVWAGIIKKLRGTNGKKRKGRSSAS